MPRRSKLGDRAQRRDAAYERARAEGYAGRAVYKLEELDRRFKLLKPGRRVLDLGCWPGSWLQYAAQRVGDEGEVVGLDLKEVETALPSWVSTRVADVNTFDATALDAFDVVLSDMAPNTTGDRATDCLRSEALAARALEVARAALRPGGHFAVKVFQGAGFKELLSAVESAFSEGRSFHTEATRAGSRELYLVGRGLKGSARLR